MRFHIEGGLYVCFVLFPIFIYLYIYFCCFRRGRVENTVSLIVGRGGDGAGRLLTYFSLGCWCGARRAEAQMDGALTKKAA